MPLPYPTQPYLSVQRLLFGGACAHAPTLPNPTLPYPSCVYCLAAHARANTLPYPIRPAFTVYCMAERMLVP